MSVAAVQPSYSLPNPITLDDLVALADGDDSHRYELSAEGVLEIVSPPSVEHQAITMRIAAWLLAHGYEPDQVLPTPGVHTGSDDRSGGRQPDLTLWPVGHEHRKVHNEYVDPSAMLAAVEIVSRSSRSIDKREKRDEYASVGIPVYLIVDDDEPHTVTVLNLAEEAYEITTRVSLARLLSAYDPKEVFGG